MDIFLEYKDICLSKIESVLPQVNMRVLLLSTLGLCSSILCQSSLVDSYVSTELPIAKAGLLANIGPDGSKSSGAKVSS
jgi:hypothetical protein